MDDKMKNINDLFALAKNAKVDYPINNITNLITNSAAATSGVAAVSTSINLSKIAIMLGSIFTIITVAVVMNLPENTNVTSTTDYPSQLKEISTIKQKNPFVENSHSFVTVSEDISTETVPYTVETITIEDDIEAISIEEDIQPEEIINTAMASADIFHSIILNAPTMVILEKGNQNEVNYSGSSEAIALLQTKINNGVLTINIEKGKEKAFSRYNKKNPVKITLTMPKLKSVKVNGSGGVYSEDKIETDKLSVQVNGSGDIKFDEIVPNEIYVFVNGSGDINFYGKGVTAKGEIKVTGSGDVCTSTFDILDLKVKLVGSGDASVYSSGEIKINLVGSGDIRYSGNADVIVSITGSGDVSKCGN